MGGVDEPLAAHMGDQVHQRVPEAVDIGKNHRLAMPAELAPGHDFHDLFQRADPARKRDERIGALEHLVLALMHVCRDDQVIDEGAVAGDVFAAEEEVRDDAGHAAAMGFHRASDRSHDALCATAIDEAQTMLRHGFSEHFGGFHIGRIMARLGTAVNADGTNRTIRMGHGRSGTAKSRPRQAYFVKYVRIRPVPGQLPLVVNGGNR